MDKDSGVSRVIVVSEKARPRIDMPKQVHFPLYIEKNILKRIRQLAEGNRDKRLYILFFHALEELNSVVESLVGSGFENISYTIVATCEDEPSHEITDYLNSIHTIRTTRISEHEFQFLAEKAFASLQHFVQVKRQHEQDTFALQDEQQDLLAMIEIGRELALRKDTDTLFRSILYFSMKITGADAGTIYLMEKDSDGKKRLRFQYSHTHSKNLPYEGFSLPFDVNSIAGYVATKGKVINVPDVYQLNDNYPFSFNSSFDRAHGYRTKSMLVAPMKNHLDEIMGIIQLINCKEVVEEGKVLSGNEAYEIVLEIEADFDRKVVPFESRYESLMEAVAAQAAIALENIRMIEQMEREFEEFVKASVTAIESRDPPTLGHSRRVARMCINMAKAVNQKKTRPYKDVFFQDHEIKELEFASLLHDFGKVYIEPSIFIKAKKLYPKDFDYLMMRLNFLWRSIQLSYAERESSPYNLGEPPTEADLSPLEAEKKKALQGLQEIVKIIIRLNEPTVQKEDPDTIIHSLEQMGKDMRYEDMEGKEIPLLTDYERRNLAIKRGSLSPEEREIIETHVTHSYAFVSKIPWPGEYRKIPDIILKHHEKLDGTGYPLGVKDGDDLPPQARMIALADIFDALTAADRPYKKAVPLDKALAIVKEEAEQNKLDKDLVDLFVNECLYRDVIGGDIGVQDNLGPMR